MTTPDQTPRQRRPAPSALTPWTLLPLRAFLGVTFCFAGLQKLANPAFFDPSSPISIQSQLAGSARLSPVHALLQPLTHVATPLGVVIALSELAVGLGTLLGFEARIAAVGGMVLSFVLFLTVSFHSSPYYTGADIVFLFAWTPFVLGGTSDVLSLDGVLARARRREAAAAAATAATAGTPAGATGYQRRAFLGHATATAVVVALGAAAAGLAAALGRAAGKGAAATTTPALSGSNPTTTTSPVPPTSAPTSAPANPTPTTTAAPPTTAAPTTTAPRPAGTAIGRTADVPVGGSASFNNPGTGDPSLVIRPSSDTFLAFDAVCPHAGCTVRYVGTQDLFACPCHGSEFNGQSGAVVRGPAPRGLTTIPVAVADGEIYVT
jgi:thiosulfate dehydrogenase (quinone) large subunit